MGRKTVGRGGGWPVFTVGFKRGSYGDLCSGRGCHRGWTCVPLVTESGVQLLAAQKPLKRQGWWKGVCFILDAGNCGGGEGRVDSCPKADSPPPPTDHQWASAFIDRGRGLHAETAQSAPTVILQLVMQWSDQCHLNCFRYS